MITRILITTAMLFSLSVVSKVQAKDVDENLCRSSEFVFFSCAVGKKYVSLCVSGGERNTAPMYYRYGRSSHIELEYKSDIARGDYFYANVLPAAPGASVRQVWFYRLGLQYMITDCIGGECSRKSGLTVLRGKNIHADMSCRRPEEESAEFDPKIVKFGSDAGDSKSMIGAIRLDDVDNPIEKIYKTGRSR